MITYKETYGNGGDYMGPQVLSDKPIANGIECPSCGCEMVDSDPGQSFETHPPQTPIACEQCGFSSMRFHNDDVIDMRTSVFTTSLEDDAKRYSRVTIIGYNATDEEVEARTGEDTKHILKKVEEAYIAGRAVKPITRLEVIDHTKSAKGRAYVNHDVKSVELSYQDDDRTLKLFIK